MKTESEVVSSEGQEKGRRQITVLSLGAGVQSSTLALMAAKGEMPKPDFAVFADTGCEPKAVYQWLDKLRGLLNFPVHITKRRKPGTLYDNINEWGQSQIPAWVLGKNGKASPGKQQCTRHWKIDPVNRQIRVETGNFRKRLPVGAVQVLKGISTDEVSRMKPDRNRWIEAKFPLIDAGMSREGCTEWLSNEGLQAPKSACFFCPWRSNAQWVATRDDKASGQWEKSVELDRELNKTGQYLHSSLMPLDKAPLDAPDPQLTLWNNDCVGMCGV